ncbi:response regulator [Burkholderia pseudomallei]|nr:response regulator [Burkholderia pseudomallei]
MSNVDPAFKRQPRIESRWRGKPRGAGHAAVRGANRTAAPPRRETRKEKNRGAPRPSPGRSFCGTFAALLRHFCGTFAALFAAEFAAFPPSPAPRWPAARSHARGSRAGRASRHRAAEPAARRPGLNRQRPNKKPRAPKSAGFFVRASRCGEAAADRLPRDERTRCLRPPRGRGQPLSPPPARWPTQPARPTPARAPPCRNRRARPPGAASRPRARATRRPARDTGPRGSSSARAAR